MLAVAIRTTVYHFIVISSFLHLSECSVPKGKIAPSYELDGDTNNSILCLMIVLPV